MKIDKKTDCLTHQEIIVKITDSKKCFRVIGTAYNDIDLANDKVKFKSKNGQIESKTLLEILHDKFDGTEYEIDIIAEPLSQLAKISTRPEGDALGTLMSKRSTYVDLLRKYFDGMKNIEPTEDVCRYELDKAFNIEFVENILHELDSKKAQDDPIGSIKEIFYGQVKDAVASLIRTTTTYTKYEAARNYSFLMRVEEDFKTLQDSIRSEFNQCGSASNLMVKIEEYTQERIFLVPKSFGLEIIDEKKKDWEWQKLAKQFATILTNTALEYLYKKAKTDYTQIRDNAAYKANSKRTQLLNEQSRSSAFKQRLHVKTYCDEIHYHMLKIDDDYFVVNKSVKEENNKKEVTVSYTRVAGSSKEALYFEDILRDKNVAEKTKKGNLEEVVPCYITVTPAEGNAESCNRYQVGQRARDAFYYDKNSTMPFVKNVAWALVFDRSGNVLLQKRGMNAKDNQDMWDKSVGGHIGVEDPNVIYGARREIIEELFTVEGIEQSHVSSLGLLKKDPAKIIFLGYWDEKRYPQFKDALKKDASMKLDDDEFYCFKFECPLVTNVIKSRRKLPSGKELYANCFVDLFFVITSKDFDVSELKNAKYLVVPPHKVKEAYMKGELTREGQEKAERFDVTPDLEELLSNAVWDNEITKFANSVKSAFEKNE